MAGPYLKVVRGSREGLAIPLTDDHPVIIGRNRADIVLDDPLVSGVHCRVIARDGQFVVHDLGSTNGTSVDGSLVQQAELALGGEFLVGNTLLRICATPEGTVGDATTHEVPIGDVAWLLDDDLESQKGGVQGLDLFARGLHMPQGVEATMTVVAGPDRGRSFPLSTGAVSIGRGQGEVALNDPEVSRKHAMIEFFGRDMVYLRDVASTNGTYRNGKRVTACRLRSGDTVGCGKTVMTVRVDVDGAVTP